MAIKSLRRVRNGTLVLALVGFAFADAKPSAIAQAPPRGGSKAASSAVVHWAPPVKAPQRAYPSKATVSPLFPIAKATTHNRMVELPALSEDIVSDLKRRDASDTTKRVRIGIGRGFDEAVIVNERTAPAGTWTALPNGWRFWTLKITSHDALGFRVCVESLKLAQGARLVVFDPARPTEATDVPAAENEPEFWTPAVSGDTAVLECQLPPGVEPSAASFTVRALSHFYRSLTRPKTATGACENDVVCYPDWLDAAAGVAMIEFVEGFNTFACTGCLLADADPESFIDFFLTAHHCVSTRAVANSVVAHWFYQTSTCGGIPPPVTDFPETTGGGELLATSSTSDFTLLRLRESPPNGVTYEGWTTAAPGGLDVLTGIHHPRGIEKKISFGNLATQTSADFWSVEWFNGVTEGGSSGSPLFTPDQLVIGQLFGGASDCDNITGIDDYGSFDVTYPKISRWIDNYAFFRAQGSYNGLFSETSAQLDASGFFALRLQSHGAYSANIRLAGKGYSFSGTFDNSGATTHLVSRRGTNSLTFQMQLEIGLGAERITGTVSDGNWTADLLAKRAAFNIRTNPAPFAPKYTLVIPGGTSSDAPGGHSYGTLATSANGLVRLSGRLADGTAFSQIIPAANDGTWPLYGNLYAGKGVIEGWMTFEDTTTDDLSGTLAWIKSPKPGAKYYPGGFNVIPFAEGSIYTRMSPILNLTDATVSFSGGNLPDLDDPITLSANNQVSNQSGNRLSLAFMLSNGVFLGHVTPPGTTRSIPFQGVVLQKRAQGFGYFLGASESGSVVIGP